MTAKKKSGDMDFEDMSEEQLAEFVKEENSKLSDVQVDVPVIDETPVEEVVEEKPQEEVQTEEPQEQPKKQASIDEEITDPYFQGKSRKELYDIIKQNNAMISRVGNEKHEIMQRLEALEVKKTEEAEKKQQELYYTNEAGENVPYNEQDVNVIRKIVDMQFEQRNKVQQEQTKQQIEHAKTSNESFWEVLAITNPQLKTDIEKTVLDEIRRDPKNTLERKDWLKTFVSTYKKPSGGIAAPRINLTSKKLKATTAGPGIANTSVTRKPVESMTADEYLEYAQKNLGIKIPRQ